MIHKAMASTGECWSEDRPHYKSISEETVRLVSAQTYSDILRRACVYGRRYPKSQIESGFKRQLQETRAIVVEAGYTIVPNVTDNDASWRLSEVEFDAEGRLDPRRRFGCYSP